VRPFDWITWRRRRDDDLQQEIASHLALAAHGRIADGEDPRAARLAAHQEFGNITLTSEATRLTWAHAGSTTCCTSIATPLRPPPGAAQSLVPAWRAALVDPLASLRHQ
jgi:hypothetical protein